MSEGTDIDLFLDKVMGSLKRDENFRSILDNVLGELKADGGLDDNDIVEAIAYFIKCELGSSSCQDIVDNYFKLFDIDPPDGWDYREP